MGEPMDRSKSPFVSQTTFEALFPNLQDVVVEGTIGEYVYDRSPVRFSIRERGGLITCPNPKCWSGGFAVDFPAKDMHREGLTEKTIRIHCAGRQNSHKGRRSGNPCGNSLEGKITLKHKVASTESL
jgi:hypothetical protein